MNKQEIEKAIELLQTVNHNLKIEHMTKDMSDGTTNEERKEYREDFRLINVAISALEKQIPKSPYQDEDGIWECPNCESQLDDVSNYCEICGQRLMGEVEE